MGEEVGTIVLQDAAAAAYRGGSKGIVHCSEATLMHSTTENVLILLAYALFFFYIPCDATTSRELFEQSIRSELNKAIKALTHLRNAMMDPGF